METIESGEQPKMNLLEEIRTAIIKAESQDISYRGPMDGFQEKGSDLVLSLMSPEARANWKKLNLPVELLAGESKNVNDIQVYAKMVGVDLTQI